MSESTRMKSIELFFIFQIISLTTQVNNFSLTETIYLPNLGFLVGVQIKTNENISFDAFLGVPFAEPPIGNLRFANPQPSKPWSSRILVANKEKSICIQKNYLIGINASITGKEDCLYLNIYRPKCVKCQNLPVMVYIHGGGFFSGSPNIDFTGPEYFMDTKRVILVTIAYRLGALGFLSTNDSAMPGNFGLKDQKMALKFIKENIKYFKGDPNRITIFGQSAGAASCHLHMLSARSREFFNKAILMSGNALAPYNEPIKDPREQAYLQAEFIGINDARKLNTYDLAKRLREVDVESIISSGDKFKHWQIDPVIVFKNVIEDYKNSDAFLTASPKELFKSGDYKKIEWMAGFVPFESAVRVLQITENPIATREFNKDFRNLFSKLLELPSSKYDNKKMSAFDRIIRYYMKGIYEINEGTKQQFGKIITDWAFYYPLYKTFELHFKNKNYIKSQPVFMYNFNYKGPYSFSQIFGGNNKRQGVVHCDDLIYLFRIHFMENFGWKPFPVNSIDYIVVKKFVNMFVDFAEKEDSAKNIKIPSCIKDDFFSLKDNEICYYKEFSNNVRANNHTISFRNNNYFNVKDMKFWDDLFEF